MSGGTAIFIVLGILVFAVAYLAWHKLGDPVEEHEKIKSEHARLLAEKRIRQQRRAELKEAYRLAKEELEDEPTIEQIFLTRDQLRMQRRLDDGQT